MSNSQHIHKESLLTPRVGQWEEIQKAHELLETNSNSGKIICTIS